MRGPCERSPPTNRADHLPRLARHDGVDTGLANQPWARHQAVELLAARELSRPETAVGGVADDSHDVGESRAPARRSCAFPATLLRRTQRGHQLHLIHRPRARCECQLSLLGKSADMVFALLPPRGRGFKFRVVASSPVIRARSARVPIPDG